MKMQPPLTRSELQTIAAEYHHLHEEHRRAGPGGSVRRHVLARLSDLERHFDRLLEEWVADNALREGWRRHLHEGAPAPAEPGAHQGLLLFKGRSAAGAIVEVRARPDGDCDVVVADTVVGRAAAAELEAAGELPLVYRLDGHQFREIFDAPGTAVAAARAYFAAPAGEPPWRYAAELAADGLIDGTFALTARGRRALARRR